MSKRYVVLAATAILAVSLAVPAFGGPSNPVADTFASAKKTAKKALKKANKANKAAKNAQTSADNAQSTADGALSAANNAQTAADAAQTTADQAITDAAAAQATADSKFGTVDFVGGTSSANSSASPKVVSANCGSAEVTGGGFVLNGATGEVTTTLSSQYGSGWIVQAYEIGGGTANNWSVQATAKCIAP